MAYASKRQYNDFDNFNFLVGPVQRRNTQRHGYSEKPSDTILLEPYQYQDVQTGESPAPYSPPAPYGASSCNPAPGRYDDPYDHHEDSNLYQHGGA